MRRRGDDDGGIIPIGGPDGKSCALFLLGVIGAAGALVAAAVRWLA